MPSALNIQMHNSTTFQKYYVLAHERIYKLVYTKCVIFMRIQDSIFIVYTRKDVVTPHFFHPILRCLRIVTVYSIATGCVVSFYYYFLGQITRLSFSFRFEKDLSFFLWCFKFFIEKGLFF